MVARDSGHEFHKQENELTGASEEKNCAACEFHARIAQGGKTTRQHLQERVNPWQEFQHTSSSLMVGEKRHGLKKEDDQTN
jgi:hypothetical protein